MNESLIVDAFNTFRTMNEDELKKIVDAWIIGKESGLTRDGRPTPAYQENWWAISMVMNWKYDNESDLLWRFILEAHRRDAPEKVVGNLAAGPMEDLMSEFGALYIARVEDMTRIDHRFKQMLSGVWQGQMSDELWSRLQKARKTS